MVNERGGKSVAENWLTSCMGSSGAAEGAGSLGEAEEGGLEFHGCRKAGEYPMWLGGRALVLILSFCLS
ncbi:hypothetical protein CgunFtcFv8_021012 [Champsocephalus gunnari]|uniref:Uncharacterized protein n=1 Tax=Champsocephalus gunnari TaxID=52237 RepID=A0AAN8EI63_CHAGU|nr:hypothetical protein CgunFtcFv8_021012 [Champsocephalus gunnari]